LQARLSGGATDYTLGNHPVFMIAKAIGRLSQRPYVVGSAALLAGYFRLWLRRAPRVVPNHVVLFRRREQMARLRRLLSFEPDDVGSDHS
jgi:hypothetical protein